MRRSATFTDRNPSPIGVVIGPLSATPLRRMDASGRVGQRIACVRRHHVGAGGLNIPLEIDARGVEHAPGCLGEFGSDPVSGDECHCVGHRGRGLYVQRPTEPKNYGALPAAGPR